MASISAIKLPSGNTYDIKDSSSGYITGMTILSYGSSTWNDFIQAYNANRVVYCRASSSSNPASGSQTRLAFMAYVNNATTPTEVEFQYYRSVSSHNASQQGDQVYVYKLTSAGNWTVTVREASVKVVAGTGLGGTYSNGTMTLTGPTKVSDLTNDSGFITSYTETDPVFSASAAAGITSSDISNWNSKVSDDKTWNGVELAKQTATNTDDSTYVPLAASTSPINMSFTPVKKTPTANAIAKYDANAYLYSTTPSANDNSTKVATTAYVDSALLNYTETDPVFSASPAHGITSSDITNWNGKQAALVSGTNIKTVNGNSLLGSGNISISYSDFVGTDGTAAGTHGLVPAPAATDSDKFLSADGTWAEPPGSGSSISYVLKSENTYTTTLSSETTIPIGIQTYSSTDVLLVDINGLDLIQGTDYTISGTNIVLTTPITTIGTKVHFVDLKMTTATTSDYATLKGEKGDDGHSPVVTASKSGTTTTVYVDGSSIASINDGTNGTHTISYTPIVTGGAQIGTITIDNTSYPLYAPAVVWG